MFRFLWRPGPVLLALRALAGRLWAETMLALAGQCWHVIAVFADLAARRLFNAVRPLVADRPSGRLPLGSAETTTPLALGQELARINVGPLFVLSDLGHIPQMADPAPFKRP